MKYKINFNYQSLILLFLWVSGLLKPFFNAYLFEFDLVLFALAIACLDIMFNVSIKVKVPTKEYVLVLLTIVGFYAYIIFSLSYTKSDSYGYTKAFNFIPNIIFFLYAFAIKKINLKVFIKYYCLVLIPLSIFFIYMKAILWSVDTNLTRSFMDLRNYYLAIGFHLGVLFFLTYYFYKKIWLSLVVFFLLLASSARGALLFAVFTFMVFNFERINNLVLRKKLIVKTIVSLLIVVLIGFLWGHKLEYLLENSINRLMVLFSGEGSSANNRLTAMSFAATEPFSSILSLFFGFGIGSFGIMYWSIDDRAYPHNLFLEIFFELGIIGLLFVLVIFLIVVQKTLRGNRIWLVLFFFCFLNTMKSSNLTDLWIFFSIMAIGLNQHKIKIVYT